MRLRGEEEKRARDRKADLSLARAFGELSRTEAEEFESLEKAYPSDPVDNDPLYPIYQALCQVSPEEEDRADQKAQTNGDVDGTVDSDVLLD